MELSVSGTIKEVFPVETFDSGFSKREFVVTTEEQYPQDVKFELFKDKTSLIDKFAKGQKVSVSFNVRGNEYNGRYFVNLQAWKITGEGSAPANTGGDDDDVPF